MVTCGPGSTAVIMWYFLFLRRRCPPGSPRTDTHFPDTTIFRSDALGLPIGADAQPWMGARPTLPDYLPAIGRSTRAVNLFYAFGRQHLGLTLGPIKIGRAHV